MEKRIFELTEKFFEIDNELSQKYYSFLKNLLISSSGFITAIIVFTDVNKCNIYNLIFRGITISSIGLGILFCSILLYGEIVVLKQMQSALREYINKLQVGNSPELDTLQVGRKRIYKIVEILCFLFYITFIISLVGFGLTL
ncbi:hypothetical protein [Tenacibaculum finnmarkense]|uniref:hypothetical protein n=1 Tax=Tenacibaculum finnmarkense TaxID=2781243 RepID=UPI001EFAE162|nr:hypothetical protein [Tenacibaculum finnmarkense]MCG8803990.1 hypothetical protein [Tenacibaculum finnmarkense]MCG8826693.1 hypothetical protein [Tenacibaculum finnmarkense]